MTNTERRNKFNTLSAHFFTGALVGINTTDGAEDGVVEFVGWDHDSDTPYIAIRTEGRFGWGIARMCPINVYRKEA